MCDRYIIIDRLINIVTSYVCHISLNAHDLIKQNENINIYQTFYQKADSRVNIHEK